MMIITVDLFDILGAVFSLIFIAFWMTYFLGGRK